MSDADCDAAALVAYVHFDSAYTHEVITRVLSSRPALTVTDTTGTSGGSSGEPSGGPLPPPLVQWCEYEQIDWSSALQSQSLSLVSSYITRKGLIRKAQLAYVIKKYLAKRPHSPLWGRVPETFVVEIDHVDYIDEVLCDLPEIKYMDGDHADDDSGSDSDTRSAQHDDNDSDSDDGRYNAAAATTATAATHSQAQHSTFLLKPSLLNQAQSLHYIQCTDDFTQAIEAEPDVKEWIVQRYIADVHTIDDCKYHIRAYLLCVGNLSVYLWSGMLALVAPVKYDREHFDRQSHITNTCAHSDDSEVFSEAHSVRLLSQALPPALYRSVVQQIALVVGELFEALHSEPTLYQPLSQAYEIYGLDFIVDSSENVWFLEANAGPDFAMTGGDLQSVIEGLMEHTSRLTIDPLVEMMSSSGDSVSGEWNAAKLAEQAIASGAVKLSTVNDTVDDTTSASDGDNDSITGHIDRAYQAMAHGLLEPALKLQSINAA